jgi:hypothetical protein
MTTFTVIIRKTDGNTKQVEVKAYTTQEAITIARATYDGRIIDVRK